MRDLVRGRPRSHAAGQDRLMGTMTLEIGTDSGKPPARASSCPCAGLVGAGAIPVTRVLPPKLQT